jgi:hypothetical protein
MHAKLEFYRNPLDPPAEESVTRAGEIIGVIKTTPTSECFFHPLTTRLTAEEMSAIAERIVASQPTIRITDGVVSCGRCGQVLDRVETDRMAYCRVGQYAAHHCGNG